jgi:membrane protease YdiL (CAAX protease family)
LLSQFLGFIFLFAFNGGISFFDRDAGEMTMDMIGRMGLDIYVLTMQVFTVLIPALLFFVLFYRINLRKWIRADMPGNNTFFPLAAMMLVFSYPLVQFSAVINQKISFTQFFSYENVLAGDITRMVIEINSLDELLVRIFVVAMIPAIGEELFYRAGLQNELRRAFKSPHLAIIVASVIFSAFHLQFDGFLPRFLLGLMLGYMYWWSSSIWVPVFVHFINNSLLLVIAYFNGDVLQGSGMEQLPSIPIYLLVISLTGTFLLAKSMIGLKKIELEEKKTLKI